MNDWEPATEVEAAMREALVATDQELYFRILARSELLLPVSAEAVAGRAPMGWGTWTTGNRTHILAFTSPSSLQICLNEPSGSYRAVPFQTLSAEWPNYEWWLAIDPGLPIEAYLPSWFVSQLTRGDVRLPGRSSMGARARMAQGDLSSALGGRVRAGATPGPRSAPMPPPPANPNVFAARRSRATAATSAAASAFSAGAAAAASAAAAAAAAQASAAQASAAQATAGQASAAQATAAQASAAAAPPVAARLVTPANGRAPIETVDAEIIDYPPAAGTARVQATPAGPASPTAGYSGPGFGSAQSSSYRESYDGARGYDSARGYDTAPTHDRPGDADRAGGYDGLRGYDDPYAGYEEPTRPVDPPAPEGGFFKVPERDLGARLRERFGDRVTSTPGPRYGGATVDFAEPIVDADATITFPEERPPTPASAAPSWNPRQATIQDAEIVSNADAWAVGFAPANETESNLLAAAEENNTDTFLSTLLLARVILPVPISMPPGSRPRDKYFPWQIEESDGQRFVAVFTSPERMGEHGQERFGPEISSMSMRFIELIAAWPSENIAFTINPGSPVGATLPGSQIVALAAWAADVGLRDEPSAELVVAAKKNESVPSMGVAGAPTAGAASAIVMQRTVPPSQLPFYLERGYDRVSGFVNRASEVAHLTNPRVLYRALGLVFAGSPFTEDDGDVHVLRWVAHRADLYRLPYGGQHEAGMRAMQGWVIERSPFRGNGFAPGDTEVVTEFKVDSVRLPHGAQMWQLTRDGDEVMVASFDSDAGKWVSTP
jgi:hypothetical protein